MFIVRAVQRACGRCRRESQGGGTDAGNGIPARGTVREPHVRARRATVRRAAEVQHERGAGDALGADHGAGSC
jgi:hypothetical protein